MNNIDENVHLVDVNTQTDAMNNVGEGTSTDIVNNLSSNGKKPMSNPVEKIAPAITIEDVKAHLEGNVRTLSITILTDHDTMAGSVVCADGRTDGNNVPKDDYEISNVQLFGGYSGFTLGMMAGLLKGLPAYLSEKEIIALNTEFTKNMQGIYEHTDHHAHEDGKCGCGHLNNIRENAEMFGLTPALLEHHRGLMNNQGIGPDALAGEHEEKGVIIIAGSAENGSISTIFSNKWGNDDQYFVLNADALSIMLDSAAAKHETIVKELFPTKAVHPTKEIILDALERGIGEQTFATAAKLAAHLSDNNTFLFDGKEVTKVNLVEFAQANLKRFA